MERNFTTGYTKASIIACLVVFAVLVISGASHAQGVQITNCTTYCHGAPPKDSTTGFRIYSSAPGGNEGAFAGNHQTHLPPTIGPTEERHCQKCHANNYVGTSGTNHASVNNYQIRIKFNINTSVKPGGGVYGVPGAPATRKGTVVSNQYAFFNQTSMPVLQSCSSVNCHFETTSPTWGSLTKWSYTDPTVNDCNKCHQHGPGLNAAPNSGAHPVHVNSTALDTNSCDGCHPSYTTFTHATSAANKRSTKVGLVQVLPAYPGSYSGTQLNRFLPSQQAGKTFGTCTGSCHMSGTVSWAPTTWPGLNCDGCHATLSGAHTTHTGALSLQTDVTFYAYTANKSSSTKSTTNYGFGCANCHPTDKAIYHINGQIDVILTNNAAGISNLRTKNGAGAAPNKIAANNLTCEQVYCHSNGKTAVNATNGSASNWFGGAWSGDRCAKCHGNSPTDTAHISHMKTVTIHQDDIFNKPAGMGKLGVGSTGNVSHGVGSQSTTIGCNTCHNLTVSTKANDLNANCSSCHSAKPQGVATVSEPKFHINGKVDVAFGNYTIISKAQVRDVSFDHYSGSWKRPSGYKGGVTSVDKSKRTLKQTAGWAAGASPGLGTCSTVICHNGASPAWNDVLTCDDCHSKL